MDLIPWHSPQVSPCGFRHGKVLETRKPLLLLRLSGWFVLRPLVLRATRDQGLAVAARRREPPVQLVGGSDIAGDVDGLHSFQTREPPA